MKYSLIIIITIVCSCTTTKKNKSSATIKIDSVAIVVNNTAIIVKADSAYLKKQLAVTQSTNSDTYRIITIDDSEDPSEDYFALRDSLVPEIKGRKFKGRIRIETGVRTAVATAISAQTDSGRLVKDNSQTSELKSEVSVRTDKVIKNKEVKRTSPGVMVYLGIGLVLIAVGIVAYYYARKHFGKLWI